ncbi:MAG: electron transfer flavoprotein subunit alpha/FixB family protein [Betaproteobacteria bacterium]|nr:electron transfer flavoprotein subunit alpha/FixB family protein [Betaproteobacteria bacterium]
MKNASNLFVVAEVVDGHPVGLCHEMLGLARALADRSGGTVHAGVLGSGLGGAGEDLIAHGADTVRVIDAPIFAQYQADAWLPDLHAMIGQVRPDAVMIGHTPLGADLAPRLAFRLGTNVATGCNHVRVEGGKLLLTRPCYGGKAEEVVSMLSSPALFTVKPKCFQPCPKQDNRGGELVRMDSILDPASVRTKVREVRRDASDGARLESARIVVAGGGGMKGVRGFELAGRLADALGGAVGASRVACDLGWCPPSRQVGLSGKTVAPELYIAIGISGAAQHVAGCANAKTIVAINTDPDAPIFRYSKYGIVGDCHQLMPALIDKIEALRK